MIIHPDRLSRCISTSSMPLSFPVLCEKVKQSLLPHAKQQCLRNCMEEGALKDPQPCRALSSRAQGKLIGKGYEQPDCPAPFTMRMRSKLLFLLGLWACSLIFGSATEGAELGTSARTSPTASDVNKAERERSLAPSSQSQGNVRRNAVLRELIPSASVAEVISSTRPAPQFCTPSQRPTRIPRDRILDPTAGVFLGETTKSPTASPTMSPDASRALQTLGIIILAIVLGTLLLCALAACCGLFAISQVCVCCCRCIDHYRSRRAAERNAATTLYPPQETHLEHGGMYTPLAQDVYEIHPSTQQIKGVYAAEQPVGPLHPTIVCAIAFDPTATPSAPPQPGSNA